MIQPYLLRHALTSASALLFAISANPAFSEDVKRSSTERPTADQAHREQGQWSHGTREALKRALSERADHGLDRLNFLPDAPPGEQPEMRDARYNGAALAYARALATGQADPRTLHEIYTLARPDPDLQAGLRSALADGRLEQWLASLPPQDEDYGRISRAYLNFRDSEVAMPGSPPIGSTGLIHVGDQDPRVADIAQQLIDEGYLLSVPESSGPGQMTYTQPIADAVAALQRYYGIANDGVVGPNTLKVLNMGPGDRARALAIALERRRWLSRTPPSTRIDVHIAAARLHYWRDGKLIDERGVIVGERGNETPMLGSPIYRLVANPTWTIPKSIENEEMAKVDPAYLEAHNMVRRDGWIVQLPGPDNALGLVKFDMLNRHAIYLHDTSSPELFERTQRHLSHGCVRVSDALGFAEMLAEQEGVADQWRKARESGEQTFVPLPREIPVRLIYGNVLVDSDSRIVFRTDPYGWNEPVAKVLGFAAESIKPAEAHAVDIGP